MEPEIYHKTAQSEESHWWFVGRRRILNDILKGLALPENAPILEVGCGTGGNLPLLVRYSRVYGMELDGEAKCDGLQLKLPVVFLMNIESIPFGTSLLVLALKGLSPVSKV